MEETLKTKKETLAKPKYNLFQNSAWMIGLAWRNQKSVLGLVVVMSVLGILTSLLGLFVAPTVLSAVQTGVTAARLFVLIALFTVGLMILYVLTNYVDTNTLFGKFTVRLKINAAIQRKAMTTAYPNTENQTFQKKLQAALITVGYNARAAEAIWETFSDLLKNIGGFIIYLLLLASLNPYIVLLVLATAVLGFLVSNSINLWSYRHRDEEDGYTYRMSYIRDTAQNHTLAKDIRIFGMKEWIDDMYNSSFKLYQAFFVHREKVYLWSAITDVVLTLVRNGVAYYVLIKLVLNNELSAAQFLLYFAAVGGFTAWVGGILTGFSKLHMQSLELSIVREFLDFPEIFKFEDGEPLVPDMKKSYSIELKNVSFRYSGAEKDTLTNINLKIGAGEKLAIVGLNGSGKTTLVKLICGFFDPTEGEVLLNGENIKRYNRSDIYKHFSAVFQEFSILEASIAENISQKSEELSLNEKHYQTIDLMSAEADRCINMEKVLSCAERAGIAEKIKSLPKKFDTQIGRYIHTDGMEFSGGETQRLMLARALYKDAPIIVLDEPTAALDPIAESDMYIKYNELTDGRTAVYISHRLASTRFCDRIILISNGIIAEEGTHDELAASGGMYSELFEIQSKYYREEVKCEEIF